VAVLVLQALVRRLVRFGQRPIFDFIGRTQRFCLPCASCAEPAARLGPKPPVSAHIKPPRWARVRRKTTRTRNPRPAEEENVSSHGKRVCWQGQTGWAVSAPKGTAKGTLLFDDLGLANVGQKTGMRRSATGIVPACLVQAEVAVHRQPDFGGVGVLLPVILPPADRTQRQRAGRLQRPAPAARAAIPSLHSSPLDGRPFCRASLPGCGKQQQKIGFPDKDGCPIHFASFAKWVGDNEPQPAQLI